jgi:hypothetical protein
MDDGEVGRSGAGKVKDPYIYTLKQSAGNPSAAESVETQTYTTDRHLHLGHNGADLTPAAREAFAGMLVDEPPGVPA